MGGVFIGRVRILPTNEKFSTVFHVITLLTTSYIALVSYFVSFCLKCTSRLMTEARKVTLLPPISF